MSTLITQISLLMTIWTIMKLANFKKKSNQKALTPFECGYNLMYSKLPLCIQFTLLAFMFLLFDIELSILIASNWNIKNLNKDWVMTMFTFIMFMIISTTYEMTKKSLKWN